MDEAGVTRGPGRSLLGPPRASLSRRDLLRGGATLAAGAGLTGLLGCGSQVESSVATGALPTHSLLAAFPQSQAHIATGVPARLPFLISDLEGVPLTTMTSAVPFTVSIAGQKVLDSQEVAPRSDGVPRAYLPLSVTFPQEGVYDIEAVYEGTRMSTQVQVYPVAEVRSPVVGQPMPAVRSPTTAAPSGVDPMCSRVPACPFHEISLDDALGQKRPIALLVGSPAYCRSEMCGPVLENLIAVAGERADLAVIHAEVYKNPKSVSDIADAAPSPIAGAFDLAFEPVLYVTDASGLITARADVIVDRTEMAELLPPPA